MSSLTSVASLGRAVTDTVGPVRAAAEAVDVVGSTAELGVGNASHVPNAELSAVSEVVLGNSGTGNGGEDSKGLHCVWVGGGVKGVVVVVV